MLGRAPSLRPESAGARFESLFRHLAFDLIDGDEMIGFHVVKALPHAAGPANLHADLVLPSQAEVRPFIVDGEKPRLSEHILRLNVPSVSDQHFRPNRTAILFHSDEFHLEPTVVALHTVSKK